MSGGSFNYFFRRAPESARAMEGTLFEMAACARTLEPRRLLRRLAEKAGDLADALDTHEELLRAVEWWKSGDSGYDGVEEQTAMLAGGVIGGAFVQFRFRIGTRAKLKRVRS